MESEIRINGSRHGIGGVIKLKRRFLNVKKETASKPPGFFTVSFFVVFRKQQVNMFP
jgi:hypothetical protein